MAVFANSSIRERVFDRRANDVVLPQKIVELGRSRMLASSAVDPALSSQLNQVLRVAVGRQRLAHLLRRRHLRGSGKRRETG